MRLLSLFALGLTLPAAALAAPVDRSGDGEPAFRALFKELVETNTEHSIGSCTQAAQQIETRLKAAGYTDADIHMFAPDSAPKDGGIVAILPGSDVEARPVLLLAHIDVVEAKREDWTRDPFALIEENGQFYGRGVADDKGEAAIFADLMIRYKQEHYRPRHTIKLALTCGEETEGVFNGAQWLSTQHKDWIDAGLALNEGIYGRLDDKGKRASFDIQAAEKIYQDFTLETVNSGGHSSRPRPDNAIYEMAAALQRVQAYEFPIQFNDATRGYFTGMARIVGGEDGAAMTEIVAHPDDKAADARLSKDPMWHAMLRTTCVATMMQAGHAPNALPQRAEANVNCRILPRHTPPETRERLIAAIVDAKVEVSLLNDDGKPSDAEVNDVSVSPPPLNAEVFVALHRVAAAMWPKIPVIPQMETGATDSKYTMAAGIPSYGFSGMGIDEDDSRAHGRDERIGVESFYRGAEFQYQFLKKLTAGSFSAQ